MIRIFLSVLCVAVIGVTHCNAKPKAPEWLTAAMKLQMPPVPEGEDDPEAVVLWDEATYDIRSDGSIIQKVRYAIRVLDNKGRYRARLNRSYYSQSSKSPKANAWLVDENGEIYKFKKREFVDVSASNFELHSDVRALRLNGSPRANEGCVFAYEYTYKDATIFTAYSWWFQANIPIIHSSISVNAPDGWKVRSRKSDCSPEVIVSGNRHTWKMKDIPALKEQKYAPFTALQTKRVQFNILPPDLSHKRLTNLRFDTWQDFSNYIASIVHPKMDINDEMKQIVAELTAGSTEQWQQILAISKFVQDISYDSISMDLGNGGGYIPRLASETLRVGYGDCKDKSTLLMSLLGIAGIQSYAVIVNARNNDSVFEDWPSPYYFNHCIVAIEIDDGLLAPAVLSDPQLGSLLFVDPTSDFTPIGELPFAEQGGLVVLGKPDFDRLLRLPLSTSDENMERLGVLGEILENGGIIGRMDVQLTGTRADAERWFLSRNKKEKHLDRIKRYIGNGNPTVAILSTDDRCDNDRSFDYSVEFGIPAYAKTMGNSMLIFKPGIVDRIVLNPYEEEDEDYERTLPVRLRSSKKVNESKIYLPIGFELDRELKGIRMEHDFGSYQATFRIEDGTLFYKRIFEIRDSIVSLDRYEALKDFYSSSIEADQQPIVLVKQ